MLIEATLGRPVVGTVVATQSIPEMLSFKSDSTPESKYERLLTCQTTNRSYRLQGP